MGGFRFKWSREWGDADTAWRVYSIGGDLLGLAGKDFFTGEWHIARFQRDGGWQRVKGRFKTREAAAVALEFIARAENDEKTV